MSSFQVGDVVQLRSGGPRMTVTNEKDGEVTVHWFAAGDERGVSMARFPAQALKRVE